MKNFEGSPRERTRRDEARKDESELVQFPTSRERERGGGAEHAEAANEDSARMRQQWNEIQARFVDNPLEAVEEADRLIESSVNRISERFTKDRSRMRDRLTQKTEASTEDLRVALQEYRSMFDRLINM